MSQTKRTIKQEICPECNQWRNIEIVPPKSDNSKEQQIKRDPNYSSGMGNPQFFENIDENISSRQRKILGNVKDFQLENTKYCKNWYKSLFG